MRILIDIGHPAHVHYFKNMISIMRKHGHIFLISARDKDLTHELLRENHISFVSRGTGANSILGKLAYLIKTDMLMIRLAKIFHPKIMLSFGSPYATHSAKILGITNIVFDDTENAKYGQAFYRPFTRWVYSPSSFKNSFGSYHFKFNSYMELSYLHPKYFRKSNKIRKLLGLTKHEKYMIIRFVSWNANHDIGHSGISIDNKIRAINKFSNYVRVFISSESVLPTELQPYQFPLSPDKMHDALSSACLFFGESATMASESAVLGVPAVYLDNVGRGYTDELEEVYGIVWNYTESDTDQKAAIEKGLEIITGNCLLDAQAAKKRILKDKIDLTAFMVYLIETHPLGAEMLKNDPTYQTRFLNSAGSVAQ